MKKYICILMAALIVLGSVSVVFAAPSLQAGTDEIGDSFDLLFKNPDGKWLTYTYSKKEFKSNAAYIQAASLAGSKSYTGTNYLGDWYPYMVAAINQDPNMYIFMSQLNCYLIGMTPKEWADAQKAADREDSGLGYRVDDSSSASDVVEYSKYVNSLIRANELTLKGVSSNASLPSLSTVPLQNTNVNLYRNSTGTISFYELLLAYLNSLVDKGFGTAFSFDDVVFYRTVNLASTDVVYELGIIRSSTDDYTAGALEIIPSISDFFSGDSSGSSGFYFEPFVNSKGYHFMWRPALNTVHIRAVDGTGLIVIDDVKHIVSGTGNNLSVLGSGQGLETFKYYYQDALADSTTQALQSNIYAKGVALGLYESGALALLEKIAAGSTAGGSVIVPEGLGQQFLYEGDTNTWIDQSDNSQHYGDLFYNPSTQSYVYNTQNYTYEITNNYNYTHINYYMPGTDVPFSQKDFYYQLPDGRNSMELRAEDVYGINTGFDVVLYDFVASDPYMQALYHFDGDTYNSALPVGFISDEVVYIDEATNGYNISLNYIPDGSTVYFEYTLSTYGTFSVFSNGSQVHRVYRVPGSHSFSVVKNGSLTFTSEYCTSLKVFSFNVVEAPEPLVNPGSLVFSVNPSYTFVRTGSDSYDSALYLDGLAHNFAFHLPYTALTRNSDFTVSFRWYQEQSTSTSDHVLSLGDNSLHWSGSKFTQFNGANISVDIPYGSWNTVTIVRSDSNLLLFINGLLVSTRPLAAITNDIVLFNFAADNNVKYFDEFLMTTVPLYTATHVPRLQPYDSNKVLVVPENVSVDTIAVHGSIPINTYRIGGVRQVFPEYGDVYVYLEGNQVKSIQQYNGFGWVEVSGMVYFAGHWYSLETFRIGGMGNAFDGNISNPDPSGGSSGSGGSSSSGNALIDLGIKFLGLLETIANRIGDIAESIVNGVSGGFTTVTGLLERVIGTIADLITDLVGEFVDLIQQLFVGLANFFSSIFEGIGDFSEDVQSVGGLFSGIFGVLPSSFIRVFIFGIILLISVSVFKLL